jgi:transcriptional regulator with XRE-family HTH domain
MDVGEAIREARLRAHPKLTQAERGRSAGVLGQEISRYERGETDPPVYRVRAIARATSRPMTWFYGPDFVDPEPPETDDTPRLRVLLREEHLALRRDLVMDLRVALRETMAEQLALARR